MKDTIHNIARGNKIDKMKKLLKKGIDINERDDEFGNSPLMTAIAERNEEMALLLIENGADVMVQNKERYNALHYAAIYNNLAVAQAILEISTNPLHAEDMHKSQPLYRALRNACKEPFTMIKLFLDKGADKNHGSLSEWLKIFDIEELTKLFERY